MLKAYLLVLPVILMSLPAPASSGLLPQPTSQPSKLFYFELNPSQQLKLEITSDHACADPVLFDRFESVQEVRSAETHEMTQVRVVQVYAHASPACAHAPSGLSEVALNVGKETGKLAGKESGSKLRTHVYLAADSSLTLHTR